MMRYSGFRSVLAAGVLCVGLLCTLIVTPPALGATVNFDGLSHTSLNIAILTVVPGPGGTGPLATDDHLIANIIGPSGNDGFRIDMPVALSGLTTKFIIPEEVVTTDGVKMIQRLTGDIIGGLSNQTIATLTYESVAVAPFGPFDRVVRITPVFYNQPADGYLANNNLSGGFIEWNFVGLSPTAPTNRLFNVDIEENFSMGPRIVFEPLLAGASGTLTYVGPGGPIDTQQVSLRPVQPAAATITSQTWLAQDVSEMRVQYHNVNLSGNGIAPAGNMIFDISPVIIEFLRAGFGDPNSPGDGLFIAPLPIPGPPGPPPTRQMAVDLEPVDLSAAGASFTAKIYPFDPVHSGNPVTPSDPIAPPLTEWTLTNASEFGPFELTADFSGIGSARLELQVFDGGALVGSTTVQDDGSVIALLSVIGPGDPSLIGAEFEVVTNSPSTILATLRFENSVNVQAVGGPSFLGDTITLLGLDALMTEPGFGSTFLGGTNMTHIDISDIRSQVVPEPATLWLLSLGFLSLWPARSRLSRR